MEYRISGDSIRKAISFLEKQFPLTKCDPVHRQDSSLKYDYHTYLNQVMTHSLIYWYAQVHLLPDTLSLRFVKPYILPGQRLAIGETILSR